MPKALNPCMHEAGTTDNTHTAGGNGQSTPTKWRTFFVAEQYPHLSARGIIASGGRAFIARGIRAWQLALILGSQFLCSSTDRCNGICRNVFAKGIVHEWCGLFGITPGLPLGRWTSCSEEPPGSPCFGMPHWLNYRVRKSTPRHTGPRYVYLPLRND